MSIKRGVFQELVPAGAVACILDLKFEETGCTLSSLQSISQMKGFDGIDEGD
jgi:hypothetical protein